MEVKATFSLRQFIVGTIGILASIGVIGTGVIQFGGTPNQAKEAIVSTLSESDSLRYNQLMNQITYLRMDLKDVEENRRSIEELNAKYDQMKSDNEKYFGSLNEMIRMTLYEMRQIRLSIPDTSK